MMVLPDSGGGGGSSDDQERSGFGGITDSITGAIDSATDAASSATDTASEFSTTVVDDDVEPVGGGATITTQGPGDGQAPEATAATGGSSDGLIVLAIKFGLPLAALAYLLYRR